MRLGNYQYIEFLQWEIKLQVKSMQAVGKVNVTCLFISAFAKKVSSRQVDWEMALRSFGFEREPEPREPLGLSVSQNHEKYVSYESYDSYYGQYTSQNNVTDSPPSKTADAVSSEKDKKRKGLLVQGKVWTFIICHECGKRRVVYSGRKLTAGQAMALERLQEEVNYSCGSSLFLEGSEFADVVVAREGINCNSNIETTYFAGKTAVFDDICFFCGDDHVAETPEIVELQREYGIVRPMCTTCLSSGKKPVVRNANRVMKKQKK
ncbi:uncharacterized protein LOC121383848 [Gigantopelta aegis]|uniref:uncharacterized protein LOC121383848 n=1 Tax=Gigantopelta aegis TaxID=1735272 RepID=UPI001B889A12|nr:uncharacterized protein LOC121383848 [Gigantopelta aegis]